MSSQYKFYRDMKIFDGDMNFIPVTALLDTGCTKGIWISQKKVESLGKLSQIRPIVEPTMMRDGSGRTFTPCGRITIFFKWIPNGRQTHQEEFYVFDSDHLDVILGGEYIVAHHLAEINEGNFTPLTEHKKEDIVEKAKRALAEEHQRQEKAMLEARRLASKSLPHQAPQWTSSSQTS